MPYVAVNAKNTVYSFVFEICVHLKFGCLRGRIRLTNLGLTMNDHFGLWQLERSSVSRPPKGSGRTFMCDSRVFGRVWSFVWFFYLHSVIQRGFLMFRTLILASTAKDKHRPDNKYLVIAHQEAAQN